MEAQSGSTFLQAEQVFWPGGHKALENIEAVPRYLARSFHRIFFHKHGSLHQSRQKAPIREHVAM